MKLIILLQVKLKNVSDMLQEISQLFLFREKEGFQESARTIDTL